MKESKCSACSCDFTEDEGGVTGSFGLLPVSFCSTCFGCVLDMANQFDEEKIEQAVIEEREACAITCEQAGIDGYGTLAAAAAIRARGQE